MIPGLRQATLDDAAQVADLETARTPDDPRDAETIAYWWSHSWGPEVFTLWVAERDGAVWLFLNMSHTKFEAGDKRFGLIRVRLHPDSWDADIYRRAVATAEEWLLGERAETSVVMVPEKLEHEIAVLTELGYREVRRQKYWELDLVANRDRLLATAERSREAMRVQGVEMLTLDRDDDPEVLSKLFELDLAATNDIPTTVPIPTPTFEQWRAHYFDNPGIRTDRLWLARIGDELAGLSLINFPPRRGIPSTEFTGTSRKHRGRGIARALKYETVAQAIGIGATRVRTDNDSENAPILHLNAEMGYRPVTPMLELHREL